MNRLASWLWRACSELGLRIELGFAVELDDARGVRTVARLPDLGAPKGMLVVSSFNEIADISQQLTDAGYGYSVLDEPLEQEEFDRESFREMFSDWGWSGEIGRKPAWMR